MDKIYNSNKDNKVVFLNKKSMRKFIQMNKKQKQLGLISGSILSVFAVMMIFNQKINTESQLIAVKQNLKQSRNIASIQGVSMTEPNTSANEKVLADVKASLNDEEAIFAKSPSKKDNLLLGTLKGSYELKDQGKNQFQLHYREGEKYKIENMNSLVLHLIDTFYEGKIQEIKKLSQAETKIHYMVKSEEGATSEITIDHDSKRRIQSIDMK